MKRLKRFILSLLLTKKERVMIWNALWFSNHTYRRRGNVDGAAAVQMVMNRTEGLLVTKGRKYSEKEVAEMIDGIVKSAAEASEDITRHVARQEFNKGYRKGRSERTIEELAEPLRPFVRPRHAEEVIDGELTEGMEFDREKCESCEGRDGCIIFALVFGQDKEEDDEGKVSPAPESEDTEKEEKDEEQASEGTEVHHEAPKEDEGK